MATAASCSCGLVLRTGDNGWFITGGEGGFLILFLLELLLILEGDEVVIIV